MKYVHYFETGSEFSAAYNGEDYLEPWVSLTSENEKVKYNKTEYEKLFSVPLTFEIQSDGIIYWKAGESATASTIEYSLNNGEWTSITSTTAGTQISVSSGDTIQFRGNNDNYGGEQAYAVNSNTFSGTTCQFKAYGNIMSLIDSDEYAGMTTLSSAYTFCHLLSDCTGLTNAENLILPATVLTFCCYVGMFQGCTSLTTAPVLPATTLDGSCYDSMFSDCTSLTAAPELPATALTGYCYMGMFQGCTALTTAPELPATTLANYCYQSMFYGCSSLNYIKCLATSISATNSHRNWVYGVSSSGTFVKNPSMSSWPTGVSGIPDGWTTQNAS